VLYRLTRVGRAAGGVVTRLCEGRFGITRREWLLIASLRDRRDVTPSALAAMLDLDRARVSRAIGSLIDKPRRLSGTAIVFDGNAGHTGHRCPPA